MHSLVSYNREIIKSEEASMSPVAVSGLYGKGVFTTLAVMDGEPFLFDKHWDRLNEHAGRLGIDVTELSKQDLLNEVMELLKANDVARGRCRITLFDSSSSGIWKSLTTRNSSVLVQTADPREIPERVCLNISPFVVSSSSPLNNIKSCNYLEQTLSYDQALKSGYDEAVRFNEKGECVSACISNIFWTREGNVFTPAASTGCLEGTTRGLVMESCDVETARAHADELRNAESVFLTSAGLGVADVFQIEFDEGAVRYKPLSAEFLRSNRLEELVWR